MADARIKALLKLIEATSFPLETNITPQSLDAFERAHDILLQYRGELDTLYEAFNAFLATNSSYYAYAGAAGVLLSGAFLVGDQYDGEGLYEAQRFYYIAEQLATNRSDIIPVQAEIFIAKRDHKQAWQTLKRLKYTEDRSSFRHCSAMMWLCGRLHDPMRLRFWYERALKTTHNKVRRLHIVQSLASEYLSNWHLKECIPLYKQVLELSPNDPWMWHNISIAYLYTNQLHEAERANRKALSIRQFGAAHHIGEEIKASQQSGKKYYSNRPSRPLAVIIIEPLLHFLWSFGD